MVDDNTDYEILPHNELEHLRSEVERLKKNPLGEKYGGHDLINSVKMLTETINHMNDIFTTTNQEMINDYQNNSMQNNFKMIASQNEQIARGILSVVDLISKQTEMLNKVSETLDRLNNPIHTHVVPSIPVSQPSNFPRPEMNAMNTQPAMDMNNSFNMNQDPFATSPQTIGGMGNPNNMSLPEPPPPKRKMFGMR